jgi:aryl-alcohol dehydrogenase-like predicted oxidoreductase
MINRRNFFGITAGAGVTLAVTPELLRALQQAGGNVLQQPAGKLMQRAIPSSGEMLPVIGLTFANHAGCADPVALKEVLKTFVDNGGRVFDAMHVSETGTEEFHATVANELGIQNKLFWSVRGLPPGPGRPWHNVKAHVETWLGRLKVPRLDAVMIGPTAEPKHRAALREMKKQGLVRYIGAPVINPARFPELESVMRNEPIDFIGVIYNVDNRGAEKTILPLAQERKIAVIALMPFGGANGASCAGGKGLFARVANTPLPEWAAEFDARTWAQFCLKYVVSHPAVTSVRTGTTKPHHMLDNIGGGIGRLPNEATRKRMAEFFDALPPVVVADRGGPGRLGTGLAAVSIPLAVAWAARRVVLSRRRKRQAEQRAEVG